MKKKLLSMVVGVSLLTSLGVNTFTVQALTANELYVNDYSAVVSQDASGNFSTIQDALSAGKTNILVKNGTYKISSSILINKASTTITGESKTGVKIIQTNTSADGIVIYADNVTISNLTTDCQSSGGTGAAIVEGHSNNVTVDNCIIHGSNSGFSVYFAGADYADDASTIAAVETNNLDKNNVIKNCTIDSSYDMDGVVLALQGNGKLINNIVTGTRIAFYMCNSSEVSGNTINNSASQGIFIAIPAFNNIVSNNIINNSTLSGIKVAAELEHPNEAILNHTYVGTGFTISGNTINNASYFGMEIDELANSLITNNTIIKSDYVGVYILRSNNLTLTSNNIVDSGYGVHEKANSAYNTNISNGITWNVNDNSEIFLDYEASSNNISNNTISNSTTGSAHAIFANSARGDSTISNNTYGNNIITGAYSGPAEQY